MSRMCKSAVSVFHFIVFNVALYQICSNGIFSLSNLLKKLRNISNTNKLMVNPLHSSKLILRSIHSVSHFEYVMDVSRKPPHGTFVDLGVIFQRVVGFV